MSTKVKLLYNLVVVFSDKTADYIYMGLHKIGFTNYTQWINNATLDYTGWGPKQPSEFATENCVIFLRSAWFDLPCTHGTYYICEQNQTYNQLTTSLVAPAY